MVLPSLGRTAARDQLREREPEGRDVIECPARVAERGADGLACVCLKLRAGIPKDSVVLPVVSTMGRLMLGEAPKYLLLGHALSARGARGSPVGGSVSVAVETDSGRGAPT